MAVGHSAKVTTSSPLNKGEMKNHHERIAMEPKAKIPTARTNHFRKSQRGERRVRQYRTVAIPSFNSPTPRHRPVAHFIDNASLTFGSRRNVQGVANAHARRERLSTITVGEKLHLSRPTRVGTGFPKENALATIESIERRKGHSQLNYKLFLINHWKRTFSFVGFPRAPPTEQNET